MLRHIDRRITAVRAAVAVLAFFFVGGSVSLVRSARAQDSAEGANNENPAAATVQVEYAAKFVCGVPGVEAQREGVKPGNYATAINIHNPNQLATTPPIKFTKHAVLALSEGTTPRPPFPPVTESLPSDFAMEVDCRNIWDLLRISPDSPFVKGFLVILTPSPNSLDVVGVYSAEPPPSSAGGPPAGMGLEVLPITPRNISK